MLGLKLIHVDKRGPMSISQLIFNLDSGISLWMRPANERRRYIVTSSLIGWAQSQNYPCRLQTAYKLSSFRPNLGCTVYHIKAREKKVIKCVKIPVLLLVFYRLQYLVNPESREINSLAPGKFEWNFRNVIFKQILVIDDWDISCEIAIIGMSLDFTDDRSTLVQVMAWCRQATSHYLSQCWSRSLSPYGITRPQWVNEQMDLKEG